MINFTSGLIRVKGTYINPDKVRKIEETGNTDVKVYYGKETSDDNYDYFAVKAKDFADAFVKAQTEGDVVPVYDRFEKSQKTYL